MVTTSPEPGEVVFLTTIQEDENPDIFQHVLKLWQLGWPLIAEEVLGSLTVTASIAIVGNLSTTALSTVSLARSIINITGAAYLVGITGPIDTYVSQAHGAGNYELIGIVLQRGVFITLVLTLPMLAAWIAAAPYLSLLTDDARLAIQAGRYIVLFSPWLPLHGVAVCLIRGLIAQGGMIDVLAAMVVLLAATIPANWLFIFKLGFGLDGSAVAALTSEIVYLAAICGITYYHSIRQGSKAPWTGFSLESLMDWGPYLKLAAACTAMVVLDFAVYDVSTILSGLSQRFNPDITVAAMGIAVQISSMLFMLPYGLGFAISSNVGNLLGAGMPATAQCSAHAGLLLSLVLTTIITLPLLVFDRAIVRIFTPEEEVIELCHRLVLPVVITVIGNAASAALTGVARACGRQRTAAGLNLVANWVLGLPLEIFLAFKLGYGALGLWVGLAVSSILQANFLGVLVAHLNWKQEARRAHRSLEQLCISHRTPDISSLHLQIDPELIRELT